MAYIVSGRLNVDMVNNLTTYQTLEGVVLFNFTSFLVSLGWLQRVSGWYTFDTSTPPNAIFKQSSTSAPSDGTGGLTTAVTPATDIKYGSLGTIVNSGNNTGTGWYTILEQPSISFGNPGYPGGRQFMFRRSITAGVAVGNVTFRRADSPAKSLTSLQMEAGQGLQLFPTDVTVTPIHFGVDFVNPAFNTFMWIVGNNAPPYDWWLLVGGGSSVYSMFFDYCDNGPVGDPEPYVMGCGNQAVSQYTSAALSLDSTTSGSNWAWYGAGTTNEHFDKVIGGLWGYSGNHQAAPLNCGANLWNGNGECPPIYWTGNTQRSGLRHPKGYGRLMRWMGSGSVVPTSGPTFNSDTLIRVNDIVIPWSGVF